VRDGREWLMSVKARSMAISSMRIPAVLSRADDDKFYERIDLVNEADAALRALYHLFLDIRLDADAWAGELDDIREWAMQDPTA